MAPSPDSAHTAAISGDFFIPTVACKKGQIMADFGMRYYKIINKEVTLTGEPMTVVLRSIKPTIKLLIAAHSGPH